MALLSNRPFPRHGALPVTKDDCSYVWNMPAAERCDFVMRTNGCISHAPIEYIQGLFCKFTTENPPLFGFGLVLYVLWLLYLFLVLGTTADNFFCPCLAVIAEVLHLSETIAGVTILAFGNGASDIFTSIVTDEKETVMMFTELIGAGIFVTALIAGSIAVLAPFKVEAKTFVRDCVFYLVCICWIAWVLDDEEVSLWESISFMGVYVVFIFIVVAMQMYDNREEQLKTRIPNVRDPTVLQTYIRNRNDLEPPLLVERARATSWQAKLDVAIAAETKRRRVHGSSSEKRRGEIDREPSLPSESKRPEGLFGEFIFDLNPISEDDWARASDCSRIVQVLCAPPKFLLQLLVPVVNQTTEKRGWTKLLNCLQIWLTPLVMTFLLGLGSKKVGHVPFPVISAITGAIVAVIVFRATRADRVPRYHNVFAFLGFLTAMNIVYIIAEHVMGVLETIGYASKISDAILGMTLLAWGNSVGDLISNVAIARQGYPLMGYAACFGGPMFNTLMGMGLTYSASALRSPNWRAKVRTSDMAPACLVFLAFSLVSSIVYLFFTGFKARRSYGYLLFCVYFIFMLINVLSELHIIHPLGSDHHADD